MNRRALAPLVAVASALALLCAAGCQDADNGTLTSPAFPLFAAGALGPCDGSGNFWTVCSAPASPSAQQLSAAAQSPDAGRSVFDGSR